MWFTSFSRALPASRVGYHTGKPIESVVYCLNKFFSKPIVFLQVETVYDFKKFYDPEAMMNATAEAKYLRGSTKTGKALKYTKTELFDKSSRKGVPKVLIVLTDGKNAHLIVHIYRSSSNGSIWWALDWAIERFVHEVKCAILVFKNQPCVPNAILEKGKTLGHFAITY